AMLGTIAIAARDSATALAEYTLAVETEPGDPELRLGYGNAFMLAKRPKEGAARCSECHASAQRQMGGRDRAKESRGPRSRSTRSGTICSRRRSTRWATG